MTAIAWAIIFVVAIADPPDFSNRANVWARVFLVLISAMMVVVCTVIELRAL